MARKNLNYGTVPGDGTGDILFNIHRDTDDNFTELYGNNKVPIITASGFPTAVAGVITLAANTSYEYSGDLSIGSNRFDTSAGGITIYGTNPNLDKITSTTTGALFTGASIRLRNIGVSVPNGNVFNMSGLGVISLPSFFVFNCVSLGTVNATGLFFWGDSNVTNMVTSGLLFSGVCRSIIVQNNSFSSFNGMAIDLGTATASLLRINENRFAGNAGATSVVLATNSANIEALGEGWMTDNFFNGDGDPISGNSTGDNSWTYRDNKGVPNSFRAADGHILGNAVATVIGTINTPVPVNFDGSFIADVQSSFTVDTDGCFTYTGATPISVSGSASIFGDSASGTNIRYRFYFAKNDIDDNGYVLDIGSVAEDQFNSADPHSTAISGIDQIVNGDKICLWVECITGQTNITIETASIHLIGN